ncbi:hypothetical protein [Dokdonella immobilis]|uniref:DUF2946 domain-containing protein n=1 Tax=Dokdonella immobilis TaxID=578942 RepID=A0A1I5AIV8_9GAMM|nr:hypothetical protein [Dokdonella immobilis]SFN62149.1 hypothetical protein SAMN05216289_13821 [Dokdonella immobilis]
MLLVFALKLASAASCVAHDYALIGSASGGAHGMAVMDDHSGPDPSPLATVHASSCGHCGTHHLTALPVASEFVLVVPPHLIPASGPGGFDGIRQLAELRPPIV